jgi:hypothetical protein
MLEPARTIGPYAMIDEVRGGMAIVYRARQRALSRSAALKQSDLGLSATTPACSISSGTSLAWRPRSSHPNTVTGLPRVRGPDPVRRQSGRMVSMPKTRPRIRSSSAARWSRVCVGRAAQLGWAQTKQQEDDARHIDFGSAGGWATLISG